MFARDMMVNQPETMVDAVTEDLIQACANRLVACNQVSWKAGQSYIIGHPTMLGMQASHFECVILNGEPHLQNTDSLIKGQPLPVWAVVDVNSHIAPE